LPGLNRLSDEQWSVFTRLKAIRVHLKEKTIVLSCSPVPRPAPLDVAEPVEPEKRSLAQTKEMIRESDDVDGLLAMRESEKRKSVLKVLDSRLDELGA
jgi:hypothetical protein